MFRLASLHEANGGSHSAALQENYDKSIAENTARQQELHRRFGAAEVAGPLVLRKEDSQAISAAVLPQSAAETIPQSLELPPVQDPEASQPSQEHAA